MLLVQFKARLSVTISLVWLLTAVAGFATRPAGTDKLVSEEAKLYWALDKLLTQRQSSKAKQMVKANAEVARNLLANLLFVRLDLELELEETASLSLRMNEVMELLAPVADESLVKLMNLVEEVKQGSNPFRNEVGGLAEALAVFVDAAKSDDPDEQIRLWQIAAQKCDELGLELGKIVCLFRLAKSQRDKGELIAAFNHFSQTKELLEQWNYEALLPALLNGLGVTLYRLGLLETAWQQFSAALEFARRQGNEHEQGKALTNLSAIAIQIGNFRLAAEFLQEAIEHGKTVARLTNLGVVHINLRDYENALLVSREAMELAQKEGDLRRQITLWN
ncbi:MAG: tetratricopeptide repeat protein, partial [Armatimonadota bacterium]|nr:tetratricopeptide repeat protein [Armatimonadota bacterium]MDW8144380.1 tetratricopeptide repeat protein [Armatimonadota bacterium]